MSSLHFLILVAAALLGNAFASPLATAQNPRSEVDARNARANGVMIVLLNEITFDAGKSAISDEDTIVACIASAVRSSDPTRPIVSYDDFRVVAFPDLGRRRSPRRPEYLGILLRQPDFRARIAPLGIRYIVFVGGATETSAAKGGAFCGYGPRGGACLAVVYWNRRSELAANIVDIVGAQSPASVTSAKSGTAWLAIIGFVPLGMPSLTQSSACLDLGERVARALPPSVR